jgi:outer membrane protein assembly factor BamB
VLDRREFALGSTRVGANSEAIRIDTAVVVDSRGRLTFSARDGRLRSIEPHHGNSRWGAPVATGEYGDPAPSPFVFGDWVFTANAHGVVRMHDINTGEVYWTVDVGAPIVASPRISSDTTVIACVTYTGEVVLIDSDKQAIRWRQATDGPIITPPVVQGDLVFTGSLDGRLRAMNRTGQVVAVYDAGGEICAGPVLSGGNIFLGTRTREGTGRLHAVTTPKLTQVFTTIAESGPVVQIAAGEDAVYFATPSEVRAVSATHGTEIARHVSPSPVAGIVLMNGALGIATRTGLVQSIDARSGQPNWSHQLRARGQDAKIAAPPFFVDGKPGELFVITWEGQVVAFAGD